MDNLTPITREEMLMNDEPMTPITREEKILAGEDLTPVTRREYFLKKYRHAGGDVMVEGLSVTENGTYTAPEGKAYSPVEVAVPLPDNAYLLKEASGSLVSFSDGADLPMPSFICKIEAVQSGSGDPSPENVRPITGHTGLNAWLRGKNLLSINSLSLNRDSQRVISSNIQPIPKGTYTISWAYSGTSQNTSFILRKSQNDQTDQKQFAITDGTQGTFTIDETYSAIYAFIGTNQASGATAEISNLMIRPSTDTDATYTPYNSQSQTIQVSWQTEAGEVFGGYVDLVSGVLTANKAYITVTDESQILGMTVSADYGSYAFLATNGKIDNSNVMCICNMGVSIPFNARVNELYVSKDRCYTDDLGRPMIRATNTVSITTKAEMFNRFNGLQFAYELATPITYQLTPTQIKSLLGNNNAWCSTGDVDIDYFAKEVTG